MSVDLLSNLIITGVHSVSTMYTLKNTKLKKICRPRWAVVLKYEGETVYTSKSKRYVSDQNHILILPKGSSYAWECTKSGHYSIIEFESDVCFDELISFSVKHSERIFRAFKDLEYKRTLRPPLFELESIRDTYSILLQLSQQNVEKYVPNDKNQKIQPAIEYISQNYNKPITNDMLALIAGMSTVYFRKLFSEVMGVSPIAYAKQLRIEKAKDMLKSDYGSLTDIAQSLGYSSLYDFSRDFKKHTGCAPSQF